LIVTLLTRSGGLLGPINNLLGLIMNGIFEFFNLFGIQNIALAIIIFTFITRALMLPLTIKQQKFTKLSSRMNPELQKIQAKYKGKKDEASLKKQQLETQAVYEKYGANPTSGCLPLLITLPIMFALYAVIRNIPAYVGTIKDLYMNVADGIYQSSNYPDVITNLATEAGVKGTIKLTSTNDIINILVQFKTKQWNELAASFPALQDTITSSWANIKHANNFFGLNVANTPGLKFPGILIPIIAAILSFVQSKQMQVKTKDDNKDNPTAAAMNSMTYVMPLMQFFFCVTFQIGIGVYWIATSVFTIAQQYFVNKYLERVDVDELIRKSVEKASKKKAKIEASGYSLQELAKKQTKSIENTVSEKSNSTDKTEIIEKQNAVDNTTTESKEENQVTTGPKSISEIANLLKNKKI
jgi:YidC/Oxa1 family membrane protein insertase